MLEIEIGQTAGDIWKYLGQNGKTHLNKLAGAFKQTPERVHQALGWLARENKIKFSQQGKALQVALTDHELALYQRSQIVPPCCM